MSDLNGKIVNIITNNSVRITDMDAGIYKLPQMCKVYFYGPDDAVEFFRTFSQSYIVITDNTDQNLKYFFSIGNNYNGFQIVNYGYSRISPLEGQTPGYVQLLNFNDIIQKENIVKIQGHPSNSSVSIDISDYIPDISSLSSVQVLSAYETNGYAMPNITEISGTNISYKLSAETSNDITKYYLKLNDLHTAVGYQYLVHILYIP